jgi:methyl-accepting chemotaxis protein
MPLGGRILAGFLLVACLSGLSGILCAGGIQDVSRRGESMYSANLVPICDLTDVVKSYHCSLYLLRDIVIDKSPQEQKEHLDRLKQAEAGVAQGLGRFFAANRTPQALALKAVIDEDLKLFDYFRDKIVDLAGSERRDEAVNIMRSQASDVTDRLDESIGKLVALNKAQARLSYTGNQTAARSALLVSGLCLSLGVVAALGIGLFLSRSLTRPLRVIASKVAAIAQGDLTARTSLAGTPESRNELHILSRDVDLMADTLHGVVGRLALEARQLSGASSSLIGTSEFMARKVELACGEIQAVADSSCEMHQTAGDIARNCTTAADNVGQANRAVQQGRQAMDQTIDSMRAIGDHARETSQLITQLGERSQQIGEITDTIDDIADQTNLLALNAAIEAARAGENGRGFAVVADEVRALAARTTGATKEISAMIRSIQAETRRAIDAMGRGVAEADQGARRAALTGEALEAITTTIHSISFEVSHIATAAEEQSATIGGISGTIQEVTRNINASAAGTQEFATAASGLHIQAEALNRIVSGFVLEGRTVAPEPSAGQPVSIGYLCNPLATGT